VLLIGFSAAVERVAFAISPAQGARMRPVVAPHPFFPDSAWAGSWSGTRTPMPSK
jgi:hypothetical protein